MVRPGFVRAISLVLAAAGCGCARDGTGPLPARRATIDLSLTPPAVNQMDSALVTVTLRASNTTADSLVVAFRARQWKAVGGAGPTLAFQAYVVGDTTGAVTVIGYAAGAPDASAEATLWVVPAALADASVAASEGDTAKLALRPLASGGDQPAFLSGTPSRPAFAVWRRNDSLFVYDVSRDSNGVVTVPIFVRFRQGTTARAAVTVDFAAMTDFTFRFVDMDGAPIGAASQLGIDGTTFTSDAAGVWRGQVSPGVRTVGIPTSSVGEPGAAYELPADLYPDSVRVVFPRFATDTLTFGQDFSASVRRAGTGPHFDRAHYLGTFDDVVFGQQGPRSGVVRFHILRGPSAQAPQCEEMAQSVLDTLRLFQQVQASELAGYYTVLASEGDGLPSDLSEQVVVLCQGRSAGLVVTRGAGGLYGWGYAFVPPGAGNAAVNSVGLAPVYGSSGGTDTACTVPSVFNECPDSANESPSRTDFDVREGLEMMRYFAAPAARRAAREIAAGRTGHFFSLRWAPGISAVAPVGEPLGSRREVREGDAKDRASQSGPPRSLGALLTSGVLPVTRPARLAGTPTGF